MVRLSARTTDDAVDLMRFEMPNLLEDMSNRSSSNMATTLGADGYVTVETLTTFRFDNRNNRISRTVTGAESYVMTYTYDLNNRLLSKTRTGSNPATTTFTYDRNGNQLTQTTGNSTKGLIYDAFNHLVRVVHGNMVAVYEYRADGLRLSKTVNGHTTTHVWEQGSIILEMNGSGAVVNRFSRGLGHLIHSEHHGFYVFNVRGDVVQRVDGTGAILHTYRYDAFGNQLNGSETNTNPFRFAAEYYDWETGFIYLRARFYNPAIGRFISEDPYWTIHNMQFGRNPNPNNPVPCIQAIMQSSNLFVYVMNNPIRFIDPLGLWGRDVHVVRTTEWAIEAGFTEAQARLLTFANYYGVDFHLRTGFFNFITGTPYHFNRAAYGERDSRLVRSDRFFYNAVSMANAAIERRDNDLANLSASALFRDQRIANIHFRFEREFNNALMELGRSLHPLQDIFAHGNLSHHVVNVGGDNRRRADNINWDWVNDGNYNRLVPSTEQARLNATRAATMDQFSRFMNALKW